MNKLIIISSIDLKEINEKLDKFSKENTIISTQFSTSKIGNNIQYINFSVLITYK